MTKRDSQRDKQKCLLLNWGAGLLVVLFLGLVFPACGADISAACSGINITCKSSAPSLLNSTQIVATANTIIHHKPLLTDPLSQENGNEWNEDPHCFFSNGAYVADEGDKNTLYLCNSSKLNYSNVAIQVDMTMNSGYTAGIVFRMSADLNSFYAFLLSAQGEYAFGLAEESGTFKGLLRLTWNKAIHTGQKNTIMVIAQNSSFQLFVNGILVNALNDGTLTSGFIGMVVNNDTGPTKAIFSNLVIYSL